MMMMMMMIMMMMMMMMIMMKSGFPAEGSGSERTYEQENYIGFHGKEFIFRT